MKLGPGIQNCAKLAKISTQSVFGGRPYVSCEVLTPQACLCISGSTQLVPDPESMPVYGHWWTKILYV